MNINLNKDVFLKPLQLINGVVERRQTLPILANVLIEANQGVLSLTATDLEVEIIIQLEVDSKVSGRITLPARKLFDICRSLGDSADITIKVAEDKATIRSGRSRFVLTTLPADDFPDIGVMEDARSFTLKQGELKRLIDQTSFAMAQQDVRYYLNGMLFEMGSDQLRTVATDGHRLAMAEAAVNIGWNEKTQVIVPRKGINELQRLLDDLDKDVNIELGINHIRFSTEGLSFTSKLVDGRFPDYEHVVPKGGDKIVIVDRDALKQALVRASILTNEKFRSISVQVKSGSIVIRARNPEQEHAEEEVEVDYSGDEFEIGFNAAYVQDALGAMNEQQVQMVFTDPGSSCLLHGVANESSRYVVMPMRI
ncbi:MAG: DNA polymerase III subunit beta [Gammaproteobacteria bacterium]|nr:DNA polymerase III subunit beta [Gammaproteobacteria bacterium]